MESVSRIIFGIDLSVIPFKNCLNVKVMKALFFCYFKKPCIVCVDPFVFNISFVSAVIINRPYTHEYDITVGTKRYDLIDQIFIC